MQHVVPNNVAICCIEMLRVFGQGLTLNNSSACKIIIHLHSIPALLPIAQPQLRAVFLSTEV